MVSFSIHRAIGMIMSGAVAVMATIVAGLRSAAEGRVVPLELSDDERRAFAASLT